ncbi:uncharacterized protein LOC134817909 [Bolinopsis microptera]|uniref:uncharacterized protein LOC134817909 n=1 Tax=Bolinopsis microptera TaxID=2820187 RepID=UPI003079CD07
MPQAGLLSFVLFHLLVSVPGEPQHEGKKVDNKFHEGGDEADPHEVDWADKKATSNHLVHSNKWGRDPELCEEFFLNGAPGQCQEQDTCCGLLNYTQTAFTVQIYCCHDNEKCCQGLCCDENTVCCRDRVDKEKRSSGYGQCCNKARGCCTDIRGNVVCCGTMLGRYWWVIAVILTIYIASKVTMMIRRYRAMPDIGEDRIKADKQLNVRIKSMTYCC